MKLRFPDRAMKYRTYCFNFQVILFLPCRRIDIRRYRLNGNGLMLKILSFKYAGLRYHICSTRYAMCVTRWRFYFSQIRKSIL